MLTND